MPNKARNNIQATTVDFATTTLHPLLPEGEVVLPQHFTYPFLYTPHPLAVAAATQLKVHLSTQPQWAAEISRGKMFGVLIVTPHPSSPSPHPSSPSPRQSSVGGGFPTDTSAPSSSPHPSSPFPSPRPSSVVGVFPTDTSAPSPSPHLFFLAAFSGLLDGRNQQPGFVPPIYDLQHPDTYFQQEDAAISLMPGGEAKSQRSRRLQLWLFGQYRVLNAQGQTRTLTDIFDHETCRIPPSGAGDCCAPKLLQYAYSHNLQPLCMAEFWLGQSPRGEIRYDGDYYPACQSKCKPILRHMLQCLDVDENPLLPLLRERATHMRIIYDDPYILAVDKPAGMLAVRGNIDAPSVESIIQESDISNSGSPLIAHRLDMDTSGIMLIAKNSDIYRELQVQFYRHIVRKRYIALLDGIVPTDSGTICIPLSPNALDRPRQMVNHQHGKTAITHYEVLERIDGRTLVAFYPETGRTHQLRVHAASPEGLGTPIVGDRLYSPGGMQRNPMQLPTNRMMLHAQTIDFIHPHTGQPMTLTAPIPADFKQIVESDILTRIGFNANW